jgi:leader peptidase (prepilin peptidase) / N-methyltransferase
MDPIIIPVLIVFGLIVGSFNNVLIYRVPRGESIVKPGSHCPSCQEPIKWYDNIPVLSYLLLRGKCRHCHEKIPFKYPAVELLTALLFVISYLHFGLSFDMFVAILFFNVGLLVIVTDLETRIIPDVYQILILASGLGYVVYHLIQGDTEPGFHIFGLIIGFVILYMIRIIGELVYKREALGLGDVKLLAVGGFLIGWPNVFLTLLFASVAGSLLELTLIGMKVKSRDDEIAFGPYLMISMMVLFLYGNDIIRWYLAFLP